MSEYDDVLTNQPVVIDNVRVFSPSKHKAKDTNTKCAGIWDYQSGFRRTGPP